jgi:hypothetical protein
MLQHLLGHPAPWFVIGSFAGRALALVIVYLALEVFVVSAGHKPAVVEGNVATTARRRERIMGVIAVATMVTATTT